MTDTRIEFDATENVSVSLGMVLSLERNTLTVLLDTKDFSIWEFRYSNDGCSVTAISGAHKNKWYVSLDDAKKIKEAIQ